jgi:hypothetical protein
MAQAMSRYGIQAEGPSQLRKQLLTAQLVAGAATTAPHEPEECIPETMHHCCCC